MRALAITGVGEVAYLEKPQLVLEDGQVLLNISHVGLCGSDLNTFRGLNPLVQLPRTPGHELAATISDCAGGVPDHIRKGDPVIVVPYTECGTCSACKADRTNACRYNKTLGVQQEGGLSEQFAVHHSRIIVNTKLSGPERALVEPLSVGFHAVDRASVKAFDTVVVLGAGMIGVGAILGAVAAKAKVIVVEPSQPKYEMLREMGVSAIIDPTGEDPIEAISKLTEDHGADVVIEAVGLPQTFRNAIDMACFAGRVVYVGYAKDEVSYDTKFFNLKELNIMGSRNATRADFEAVIAWMVDNRALANSLISKTFAFDEADQAFDYWERIRDQTFKVMIDMTQGTSGQETS